MFFERGLAEGKDVETLATEYCVRFSCSFFEGQHVCPKISAEEQKTIDNMVRASDIEESGKTEIKPIRRLLKQLKKEIKNHEKIDNNW